MSLKLLIFCLIFSFFIGDFTEARRKRPRKKQDEIERKLDIGREIDRTIEVDYEGEDYYSASHKLNFLGEKAKKKREKAKAFYYVARSLIKLGMVNAAIPFFTEALNHHDNHYTPLSLKGLFRLSEYLKEDKFIHSALETVDYEFLPSESRAEVNYYLGKSYYNDELYGKASRKLEKVLPGSYFYPNAIYLNGLIKYRDGNANRAADDFKGVIEMKEARDTLAYDLSALGLGRIYYESQKFKESVDYYRLVTKFSSVWPEALFEMSWAYFLAGNPQKALGSLHSLHSPYYEQVFNPESHLLAAIIFYSYCWFKDANTRVEDFLKRYTTLNTVITKLRDIYAQTEPQTVFSSLAKKAQSGDKKDEFYRLIFNFIASKKTFQNLTRQIDFLEKERKANVGAPKFWEDEFFPPVKDRLAKILDTKKKAAGHFIRDFLKRDADSLSSQINQAKIIQLEIKSSQKERLEEKLRQLGEKTVAKKVKQKSVLIEEGYEFWPFTGEYWKDEMGYYIYNIVNICSQQQ